MVFERALMDAMAGPDRPVPVSLVHWSVTGIWPAPALRFDVAYPRGDWSRLPGI